MTRKLTGSTASGKTQPEIRRGQNWRDGYGELLTVTDIGFNRVTFIRNGYEHPCIYPLSRFEKWNSRLLTEALKMRDNLVNDVRKRLTVTGRLFSSAWTFRPTAAKAPVRSGGDTATGLTTLSSAEPITVHIVALAQGWIWS